MLGANETEEEGVQFNESWNASRLSANPRNYTADLVRKAEDSILHLQMNRGLIAVGKVTICERFGPGVTRGGRALRCLIKALYWQF